MQMNNELKCNLITVIEIMAGSKVVSVAKKKEYGCDHHIR